MKIRRIILLGGVIAVAGIGVAACQSSPTASPVASDAPAVTAPPTTSAPPTTTAPVSPYPAGEEGDKDFAVSSLSEGEQAYLNTIGGTIRVTNVGDQTYSSSFTVTFFATKDFNAKPLGSAVGFANGVAPGQTVTETLTSTDAQFTNPTFYYQFQVDAEF